MKRTLFCLVMGVFLTLSVSVPVLAQFSSDLLSSSLITSGMSSMAFQSPTDNVVFICTGYGVASYDVTNLSAPTQLDVVATAGMAFSADVATINNTDYLIVADRSGMAIINIDNPSDLFQVGYYGVSGNCRSLDVEDDVVYLVGELTPGGISYGLKVIDISNPTTPTLIGQHVPFPGVYYDVQVVDTLAFVAAGSAGIHVLGVGNPTAPYFITQSPAQTGIIARSVLVNPALELVIAADGGNLIRYYDYSSLAFPMTQTNAVGTGSPANYLAAYGDQIIVLEDNGNNGAVERITWTGLTVGNTFNPAAPPNTAVLKGDYLWLFEGVLGYQVLNLAPPGPAGGYREYGGPRAAIKVGDYAYVANYSAGVAVLNMNNFLTPPTLVVEFDTGPLCYDIGQWGSYVYAIDFTTGNLLILDVTTPGSPDSVNTITLMDSLRALDIADGYLYIATNVDGVQILDLNANPTSPSIVGSVAIPYNLRGITAAGGYLYVAAYDGGVIVYGLTNPILPDSITTYDNNDMHARMVAVEGDLVAVAFQEGAVILNFDGASFTPRDTVYASSEIRGVTLDGDLLYLADWEWGVDATEITGQDTVNFLVTLPTPGQAYEVIVWDPTHILVCDSYSLLVYEHNITGVKPWTNPNVQPSGFSLIGNYPNPFNPSTTIAFNMHVAGKVTVNVFDMMGRLVATAFEGELPAGEHHLLYNGGNLASGTYAVQVVSPWGEASSTMVLLK